MTRKEQRHADALATEILKRIVALCNEHGDTVHRGPIVGFADDWGGNSVTLYLPNGHTHVGIHDLPWHEFVRQLHNQIVNGTGLSVNPIAGTKRNPSPEAA